MAFKVGQKYRTNNLSHIEGGYTIIVEKRDGKRLEYNNIKHPHAYIRTLLKNKEVKDAWLKEEYKEG